MPGDPIMAAQNFETIMDHVFRYEGGYSDHPSDPGGATQMGITIGVLGEYRGKPVTKAEVKALTKEEARAIYRKRYWDVISGDELPSGVDLVTMDSAVNSGPGRGAKWLQRAVGVKADGQIGTATLSAIETANAVTTVERMCDDRLAFLKGLKTWGTFGKGWSRRVDDVRAAARELAEDGGIPLTPAPAAPVVQPTPAPAAPSGWDPALTVPEYLAIMETSIAAIRKLTAGA
jgi:lysozyme family protein